MDDQQNKNPVTPPPTTDDSAQMIYPDSQPTEPQPAVEIAAPSVPVAPSPAPQPIEQPAAIAPPSHLDPIIDPEVAKRQHAQRLKKIAITSGSVAMAVFIVLGAAVYAKQRNNHQQLVADQQRTAEIAEDVSTTKPLETEPVADQAAAEEAATTTAKSSSAKTSSSATAKAATTAAATQVKINSKCFSITLPKSSDIQGDSNDCSAGGSFSDTGYFDVTPVTQNFLTLGQAVYFAKQIYGITSTFERGFKLAGLEAFEIGYNYGSAEDPPIQSTSKILVVVKDKGYTNNEGTKLTGFEINMTTDTAANKKALETLLSTWSWR